MKKKWSILLFFVMMLLPQSIAHASQSQGVEIMVDVEKPQEVYYRVNVTISGRGNVYVSALEAAAGEIVRLYPEPMSGYRVSHISGYSSNTSFVMPEHDVDITVYFVRIRVPSYEPMPTNTPVPTATPSPIPMVTLTAEPSPTPTVTLTAEPSPTLTITPTAMPSPTLMVTPTITSSPTSTVTPIITQSPMSTMTPSPTPELMVSPTPIVVPTTELTIIPVPTVEPTITEIPIVIPESMETNTPTPIPTVEPTEAPTITLGPTYTPAPMVGISPTEKQPESPTPTPVPQDNKESRGGAIILIVLSVTATGVAVVWYLAFLFLRWKRKFHGIYRMEIISDASLDFIVESWYVPKLTDKLREGMLTVEEYISELEGSWMITRFPADTKMIVALGREVFTFKASEQKLFELLRTTEASMSVTFTSVKSGMNLTLIYRE